MCVCVCVCVRVCIRIYTYTYIYISPEPGERPLAGKASTFERRRGAFWGAGGRGRGGSQRSRRRR